MIKHYEFQDKTILNRAIVTEFEVYRTLGESAHRLVLAHARSKLFMNKKCLTEAKIKSAFDVLGLYRTYKLKDMQTPYKQKTSKKKNSKMKNKFYRQRLMEVFGAIYVDGGVNALAKVMVRAIPYFTIPTTFDTVAMGKNFVKKTREMKTNDSKSNKCEKKTKYRLQSNEMDRMKNAYEAGEKFFDEMLKKEKEEKKSFLLFLLT